MSPASDRLARVGDLIGGRRYRFAHERELQDALERVLADAGIAAVREAPLGADRVDFLVDGDLALEVKVDGSLSAVTRQLHAYAQRPNVAGLLLVTSRARHRAAPRELAGKPVHVLHLMESAL